MDVACELNWESFPNKAYVFVLPVIEGVNKACLMNKGGW
jgi:hypothetical protein